MKETLATISERTGYSITTVSRVLNGKGDSCRISKKAQSIIQAEAIRCKYTPNIVAQNLRNSKTNTIGLILPSISNKYFADIAHVIIAEAYKNKYTTIVVNYMESEKNLMQGIHTLVSQQVDGIIASPTGDCRQYLEDINQYNIPVVLIDRYFEDTKLSYVTTDNYKGSEEAVKKLISYGHTKICCLQGVRSSLPNKRRVAGYIDVMKNMGLENNITVVGNDFSIDNGYLETKLLLNNEERPTAIFALSNTIGLGVIKALKEAKLRIPDDISLISFDNNLYLDFLDPAITRISQPTEGMASLATKILFENIESGKGKTIQMELSPEIILRESIKRI